MGKNMKTFKYISEGALEEYGYEDKCYWCKQEAKLYRILIENVETEQESDEACIQCIKTLPLKWIYPKDDEKKIASLINKKYPKGTKTQDQRFALTVETCDEYRRTPQLCSFVQSIDWPDCCGDFTEFLSDAKDYEGDFTEFLWWGEDNHFAKEQGLEVAIGNEGPCVLYKCLTCSKKYWTHQCT